MELDRLLPGCKVRERYSVSDMTIWRWRRNDELNFPKPVSINERLYWRLRELEAWEGTRGAAS